MWLGIAIGLALGIPQLAKRFATRQEPEPRHGRFKLPATLFLLAVSVTLAALDEKPLFFAIFAALLATQVALVLAGRNPWWMQGWLDERERPHYSSGQPRDLDPSS
ncbi:MAG TPA: hypothetical protein VLJ80_07365 [Solirubrobacteraceae bacterium]|nr:hypothetical protein [Solirubrobacteraceae bacterium]